MENTKSIKEDIVEILASIDSSALQDLQICILNIVQDDFDIVQIIVRYDKQNNDYVAMDEATNLFYTSLFTQYRDAYITTDKEVEDKYKLNVFSLNSIMKKRIGE